MEVRGAADHPQIARGGTSKCTSLIAGRPIAISILRDLAADIQGIAAKAVRSRWPPVRLDSSAQLASHNLNLWQARA